MEQIDVYYMVFGIYDDVFGRDRFRSSIGLNGSMLDNDVVEKITA